MTDREFSEYLTESRRIVEERQRLFSEEIGRFSKYGFDLDLCTISFWNELGVQDRTTFEVVPIGTFNRTHGTWFWAWANDELPAYARERSASIRKLFEHTGFRVFEDKGVHGTSKEAEDLCMIAVRFVNGIGFFKSVSRNPWLYLGVLRKVRDPNGSGDDL